MFEQDLLHFFSKIIRRHGGGSKFNTKCRLAKGTILKNTLLKKEFYLYTLNIPLFYTAVSLFVFICFSTQSSLQVQVLCQGFILSHSDFNEGSFVDFSKYSVRHSDK